MLNEFAECCRCRYKHMTTERIEKPRLVHGIHINDLVCPQCGAREYFRVEGQAEQEVPGHG